MLNVNILIGKTIARMDVDGFDVNIIFTDGTVFEYESSDGGYSSWSIYKNDNNIDSKEQIEIDV